MAYTLQTNDGLRLIDVRYSGSVSIQSRVHAHTETQGLLERTGYRRILIDYRAAQPMAESFEDINKFVTRITSDPVLRLCRIAFVGNRSQLFNATVEALADARHYPFMRFHERDAAVAWLSTHEAGPD